MIQSPLDLSVFVQVTLKSHKTCRVYGDLLQLCWDLPKQEQADAIMAFARKYGWEVEIHEPDAYGMVADFVQRHEEVQRDATDDLTEWCAEPKKHRASA